MCVCATRFRTHFWNDCPPLCCWILFHSLSVLLSMSLYSFLFYFLLCGCCYFVRVKLMMVVFFSAEARECAVEIMVAYDSQVPKIKSCIHHILSLPSVISIYLMFEYVCFGSVWNTIVSTLSTALLAFKPSTLPHDTRMRHNIRTQRQRATSAEMRHSPKKKRENHFVVSLRMSGCRCRSNIYVIIVSIRLLFIPCMRNSHAKRMRNGALFSWHRLLAVLENLFVCFSDRQISRHFSVRYVCLRLWCVFRAWMRKKNKPLAMKKCFVLYLFVWQPALLLLLLLSLPLRAGIKFTEHHLSMSFAFHLSDVNVCALGADAAQTEIFYYFKLIKC